MRRISRLKNILWYSGVGLLVLMAVVTALFRLLFTTVEDYRQHIETVAGHYLGLPVNISGMEARVVGMKPTVVLQKVALLQTEAKEPLARFASVSIALDPISSLYSLSPVVELTVGGANLIITRSKDGAIGLQGMALPVAVPEGATGTGGGPLGNWILGQNRLALSDSRIVLHDEVQGGEFEFDNVELELRNDGDRHRLNGFVRLPKEIGKELRVAADIRGNLLEQRDWWGTLYMKSAQLQAGPWLEHIRWHETALRDGVLDTELWSHWRGGFVESIVGRFDTRHLQLQREGVSESFARLAGELRLQREEGGWRFELQHLLLQRSGEEEAMPSRLQLSIGTGNQTLQVDRVRLQDVAPLAALVPQLDDVTRRWLLAAKPSGMVEALHLQRNEAGQVRAAARVAGLQLEAHDKIPGMQGVDIALHLDGDNAALHFNATDGALALPRIFRRPLVLGQLDGTLQLHHNEAGWRLHSDGISVANRDAVGVLSGEVLLPQNGRPWLGLQLALKEGRVEAVRNYLPSGKLSGKTLDWLDNAFVAGRIAESSVVFHGHPADFPFRGGEGHFEARVEARGLQLHYQNGWPDLHAINGEVVFVGSEMTVEARSGRLFGGKIGATRVTIHDLMAPQLVVEGRATAPADDGLRFLRESPLGKHGGGVIAGMKAEGTIDLVLALALPLRADIATQKPLRVSGELTFNSCHLAVVDGVTLEGLSGDMLFTEKSFDAFDLRADIYDAPASIVVMTEEGEQRGTYILAHGRASAGSLRQAFKLPVLDYIEGESDWQASLQLPHGGEASSQLQIHSSLEGMALTLPEPAAKPLEGERPLDLAIYLGGARGGEYQLKLGEDSGVAWRNEPGKHGVRRARVVLGVTQPLILPTSEIIEVVGRAEGVSLAAWNKVFQHLKGESEAETARPAPIEIRMDRLHLLAAEEGAGEPSNLQPGEAPPLLVEVKDFGYDNMQLGEVSLRMKPDGERMVIKPIAARSSAFNLEGSGSWDAAEGTSLSLTVAAARLDKMMAALGFANTIRNGKTSAEATVEWRGAPVDFALARLDGDVHLKIEEGVIEDVEPGAGRLLGVLSISALPRRLFLDFSDLLQKGLQFSTIEGDVRIEQGQAYTSNLHLESLSANVLITGRTGLVAQDFDQQVIIVPNVSDSVSVAGALAWGPQVAAILLVLQKIFQSDIDAATMIRYQLGGTWRDPVITRLDETSAPVLPE